MTLKSWTTLIALGGVASYATFNNAGLDLTAWHWSLLFVGLIACFHYCWPSRDLLPKLESFILVTAGVFLFLAAIQVVPLPLGLLQILSPGRVDLFRAALPVIASSSDWVPLSAVPYQTADQLLTLAGYTLIALILRDLTLQNNGNPWITVLPILVVGTLEAGFSLLQASGGSGSAATGSYTNRDHFASLLEMLLPFAVMMPISFVQRDHEYRPRGSPASSFVKGGILLSIAAVLFLGILNSASRIGLILSLAEVFVISVCAFFLRGWTVEYEVSATSSRKLLPFIIVGLIVVFGLILLPTDPLIARFSDFAKTEEIPANTRLQIWRDTTRLIRAFPLFGCGLGGFSSCFLRYKTTAPLVAVSYAHNDYLQVLAELGIFGFVAGMLFVFRVLQRAVHGCQYAQSLETRYLAVACTSSIVAMLIQSTVDFNVYVPANGLVIAWIIGIAGTYLSRPKPSISAKTYSGLSQLNQGREPFNFARVPEEVLRRQPL